MPYSVAVDIGGTFTDIVLRSPDGRLSIDKTLTTHDDLIEGFMHGVHGVLAKAKLSLADIDGLIVHATTIVTNALIERKGRPTALLATEGFTDVLSIRNENRYDVYDLQIEFPEPLVSPDLTFGIRERTLADGSILLEPDSDAIRELAPRLKAQGVTAVAICFLNSFANPANEQRVAELLAAELPDILICTSSNVAPVIREYPRASTTVVNAYTMPIAGPYLNRLGERLRGDGLNQSPLIMLSSGGVVGASTAGRNPVRMIESGPAAGALAASYYSELLGIDRLISFDMGGTTAKICLIEDRTPLVAAHFEIDRRYRFKEGSGLPVTVPSIDMIEIGAGGGSIAGVDRLGLLKVGPRSAGSEPGPACYGRGGKLPTVTDANLILGLLDPNNFLGGEMPLDRQAAESTIGTLGEALGLTPIETARGIFRVVNETMAASARTHSADRGIDYRGMPLFAFGGAGAIHACAVAELLRSSMVIVPPKSSVLSAVGTLVTPARLDLMRSHVFPVDDLDWEKVRKIYAQMRQEAVDALGQAGAQVSDIVFRYETDLRYQGQQYEVTVGLDFDPNVSGDKQRLRLLFEQDYRTLYGLNPSNVPVEAVTWRLSAGAQLDSVSLQVALPHSAGEPKARRAVFAWGDQVEAPVFDRSALAVSQRVAGPVIIEERETTTVIPPRWTANVDRFGCIIVTQG